jgi:hypothetical protein
MPLLRRRPLLRAVAVSGGAYCAARRRLDLKPRNDQRQQHSDVQPLESSTGGPERSVTPGG